jgi:hypothetical protein
LGLGGEGNLGDIVQSNYLKASNTDARDFFGRSVALSGNTLVVGAPYEDSAGDQNDNSIEKTGAVYVFVRDGDTWRQQAYLKGQDPQWEDFFGWSVAISGDTLVVGTPSEEDTGSAYVFVRDGEIWSQQTRLKASNIDADDHFGTSVAILGNTVAVGARLEDSSSDGIAANQSDNSAYSAGAVYLFERQGDSWSQTLYIKADKSESGDEFGYSLALTDTTLVVGALRQQGAGAVYVYVRDGDGWLQQAVLRKFGRTTLGLFGVSVAIFEDTIAVGANENYDRGVTYLFERNGQIWNESVALSVSAPNFDDRFGESLALNADTLVVGAHYEDSSPEGLDGAGQYENSGAAYVYARSGDDWTPRAHLKASNAETDDYFGFSVALDDDTLAVGARLENSAARGIDGNMLDNSAQNAGAVYVFMGL